VVLECSFLLGSQTKKLRTVQLIYSKQNKLDAAVNCYKQALDIYPNFPKALQNLGAILLLQDKTNAQESSMSD
jgi:Flp pilus assembly protein TadD